jgi:hypothetical protein
MKWIKNRTVTCSRRKMGGRENGERFSSSKRALGEANVKRREESNFEAEKISQ